MAYGLKVYDYVYNATTGTYRQLEIWDSEDISFTVIGFFSAPANQTTTIEEPLMVNFSEFKFLIAYAGAFQMNLQDPSQFPKPHTVTASGMLVTASGGNQTNLITVLAR